MLEGEADVSTAAELALVRYALARKAVRTLGSIDMLMHMKLIGRKDRGIKIISDLGGKRIGVPLKTAADFNLPRFLDLHGIDKSKITNRKACSGLPELLVYRRPESGETESGEYHLLRKEA
jgi:ABC-type nitrate/sulfonate/bicarbonate transport system substrate-binding protein